jgi:hypothetical protein
LYELKRLKKLIEIRGKGNSKTYNPRPANDEIQTQRDEHQLQSAKSEKELHFVGSLVAQGPNTRADRYQ